MKHFLRKGQRLESVSARYKVPVCMIVRANDLAKKKTYGFDISIPNKCYCNRCPSKTSVKYEMYEVKASDSMRSIAEKFGVKTQVLMRINGIGSESDIRAHDIISVPIG